MKSKEQFMREYKSRNGRTKNGAKAYKKYVNRFCGRKINENLHQK
jgi:hypothetical protein